MHSVQYISCIRTIPFFSGAMGAAGRHGGGRLSLGFSKRMQDILLLGVFSSLIFWSCGRLDYRNTAQPAESPRLCGTCGRLIPIVL